MHWIIIFTLSLTIPDLPYHIPSRSKEYIPKTLNNIPIELYGVLVVAEGITSVPKEILAGIAFAETSYNPNYKHTNPLDKSIFGLHERNDIRLERIKKHGYYNPNDTLDAAIETGNIFNDNLRLLNGSIGKAIAAHFQGPTGVKINGIDYTYLNRVRTIYMGSIL